MTYDPRNPDPRRPTDEEGSLGAGIVATAALAVLAIAGIAFYIVSADRTTISAIDRPPEVESPSPATSGQGAPSRMPTNPERGR